jgi:predicted deacylase
MIFCVRAVLKIVVGTASAASGTKDYGFLEVSRSPAGMPIAIPVIVINGVDTGPTLVASAAMHGTEVLGTIALSRFFRDADPEQFKGTFIGAPILNTWAFEAQHRVATLQEYFGVGDLEQLFPGDERGYISDRIAYAYMNEIARRADCLLDFHGQDHLWQPTLAAIVPGTPMPEGSLKPKIYQKCLELAKVFGVEQIWRYSGPGKVTAAIMSEKDIPAINLEYGGLTDFRQIGQYVESIVAGLTNVMKWLGMIEGLIEPHGHRTVVCDLYDVKNRFGGIWSTNTEVGRSIQKEEIAGTVSDPITGVVLEEIRASLSGVITNLWASPVIRPAVGPLGIGKVVEYI